MRPYISDSVLYIGADDHEIDLFESQYPVPNGVSYNSYVIMDEKIAVMDTADRRASDTWFSNLETALNGREPDYLVISHMEPDHAYNIGRAAAKYPSMKLVVNAKTIVILNQFFEEDFSGRLVTVKEGDTLGLGVHTLTFYMAPMVHWPEVMVEYEQSEKILFSADAFGKFGALDTDEPWEDEARRYFINIVGKYGNPVQMLLKKAATLDIKTICPLHGPVLTENLSKYIEKYSVWSSYEPEEKGVTIAYCSIHGNTEKAALMMKTLLDESGNKVSCFDLARCDISQAIASAYRYDRLLLAAPTYDGGMFPFMEDFLNHLKSKAYQKRTVAVIENGSWAPMSGKLMRELLSQMKNVTVLDNTVTIRSAVKPETKAALKALCEELTALN